MQKLKYLFEATYKDGHVYLQNPEDLSVTEPEKRSCYFDIAKDAETGQIAFFAIKGDGQEYRVDLRDGHFEVNGLPFLMHEGHLHTLANGRKVLLEVQNYKLIYHRKKVQNIVVGVKDGEKKSISEQTIGHCIGWEAKASCGHVEQRIMEIP